MKRNGSLPLFLAIFCIGSVSRPASASLSQEAQLGFCGYTIELGPEQKRKIDAAFEGGTAPIPLSEVPAELRPPAYIATPEYLSDGKIVKWTGPVDIIRSGIEVINEEGRTEKPALGVAPMMSAERALSVLHAAKRAWGSGNGKWPRMSVPDRVAALRKFNGRLREIRSDLILWIMWETSKTLTDATAEVDRTIQFIDDTLDYMLANHSNSVITEKAGRRFDVTREPRGVSMIFGPYNYPLNETFQGVITALVTGNTVVIKPANWGLLLMNPIQRAFQETLPAGAVNFVYGDGREIFSKIAEEGWEGNLFFIGSTNVGHAVVKAVSTPDTVKTFLGTGAKDASVVLEDADTDAATKILKKSCFGNSGQRCTATNMLFVHKNIAPKFLPQFVQAIEKLQVGKPWDAAADLTPSPARNWSQGLQELVDDAVAKGAKVLNYGGGQSRNGYVMPTLLIGVTPKMRIYHEGAFGPVVPVVIYKNRSEILNWQTESPFGQQIAFYGQKWKSWYNDHLRRLVGRINNDAINERGPDDMAFTARKGSGLGDGSMHGLLDFFTMPSPIADGSPH